MTLRNLELVRGDSNTFTIFVIQGSSPVDITGKSFRLTAKYAPTDSGTVFSLVSPTNISIVDASNGQVSVVIPPASTSGLPGYDVILYWDLQMYTSATDIVTVVSGKMRVFPDISITSP